MGYIYLLYNDEGKGYIGRTKNITQRLNGHRNRLILDNHKCEILEEVDNDYLVDYEQYYYEMYNEMFPNMLVNKCRPSVNKTKKDYDKEYYTLKREKKINYAVEYNKLHKEKRKEVNKKYWATYTTKKNNSKL